MMPTPAPVSRSPRGDQDRDKPAREPGTGRGAAPSDFATQIRDLAANASHRPSGEICGSAAPWPSRTWPQHRGRPAAPAGSRPYRLTWPWQHRRNGTTITHTMRDVKIDPSDPVPLFEQVAAEIRRAIADGEAGPGERLPLAKDMAKVLG